MTTEQLNQKPVFVLTIGMVKGYVWANNYEGKVSYNVTIGRLYKRDTDEDWQTSDSFGRYDLLNACNLLIRLHSWILKNEREKGE